MSQNTLDFLVSQIRFFNISKLYFISKILISGIKKFIFSNIEFIFISKYTPKILKTAPYETRIFWYRKSFSDIRKYNFWYQKIQFLKSKIHFDNTKSLGFFSVINSNIWYQKLEFLLLKIYFLISESTRLYLKNTKTYPCTMLVHLVYFSVFSDIKKECLLLEIQIIDIFSDIRKLFPISWYWINKSRVWYQNQNR